MEQSRHARKFFDLAWLGMGAEGAVDPMVACNRDDSWLRKEEQCRVLLLPREPQATNLIA